MKIIFKIAKNELRNLFYSPVAWFLAIVFLIQCAYFYTNILSGLTVFQDQLLLNNPKWKDFGVSVTRAIFLGPDGIMANAFRNLYLFIPLLTMGIISREVSNGTIKLLYSSPVKLRHIIFGKYLAIMIYNLVLVSILGMFVVSGVLNIKAVDIGLLLSALLGFYLLVSAFSAIGFFMSSLTTYQIVSGIGTFIVIFILSRIGTLWQKYDFVRDLTYFLSIAGRTEKMLIGLITTKDLIYFFIVIFMFLSFTLLKIRGERESKPWTVKAVRYLSVILVSVLIGYITSRPFLVGYWDTTAANVNTIHPRTQKLLREIGNEPLEVTMYTNLFDGTTLGRGVPEARNMYLSTLWDNYLRFKPDITFKYVYYYDNDGRADDSTLYKSFPGKTEKQIAGIMAKMFQADESLFMEPDQIRKIIDPYSENSRLFMAVKYKDRMVHLRTFDDNEFWPNQTQIASGLKKLIEGSSQRVGFLTGNLERSIYKTGEREYSAQSTEKRNRTSLINMSFDPDSLSLDDHDIPSDLKTLVIADPKTSFTAVETGKIQQYIDRGGNLIVFGEPGKQAVINPVLERLGVQLRNGTLVQRSKNETPDKVIPYGTDSSFNLAEEISLLALKRLRKEKNTDDSAFLTMPGAAAISYVSNGPFTITPLTMTVNQKAWLKAGILVIDSVPPVFNPQDGDVREPSFATSVQLTRQMGNKQQRIIVCSDADFRNNLRLNADFYIDAFYSWLNYGEYPIYVPETLPKDVKFTITTETAGVLEKVFVWILPGLLLVAGTILLIRRKRK